MDCLLTNYKSVFPFFTNHTFEHSTQVINYCNIIAGSENINRLNADEMYILLMPSRQQNGRFGFGFQTVSAEYTLFNGSKVNLAYIAALVKLADELDITSDRNLFFDYSKHNSKWSENLC